MAHLLLAVVSESTGDADDEQHQQGEGSAIVHGVAQHDILLNDRAEEADIVHCQELGNGKGGYGG